MRRWALDHVGSIAVSFGLVQLAFGLWMAISPGSFQESIGDFGVRNDHFVRDFSTLYLALGFAFLLGARRRRWLTPLFVFAAVQYGLHALNHLIDVGDIDPAWVGAFEFVVLSVVTAALGALAAVTSSGEAASDG